MQRLERAAPPAVAPRSAAAAHDRGDGLSDRLAPSTLGAPVLRDRLVDPLVRPTVQRAPAVPFVQRLSEGQDALLLAFSEGLAVSPAAALRALSRAATMTDFREVVNAMSVEQVTKLMTDARTMDGLAPGVQPYVEWLGEVRNERIASGAEALVGQLDWVTSGAAGKGGKVVPKDTGVNNLDGQGQRANHFTRWLRGEGGAPTDVSSMNCWEACLYAGYKAGVFPKWLLGSIYAIACADGTALLQSGQQDKIVAAYSNAIAAVLGAGEETWRDGDAPPPRGHLVFFDGPSHVAVSRGVLGGDGTPAVMSLWCKPGPHPVMQATTMGALSAEDYTVTFGPAPW
ncbi:MAG: hypothetical protein Q8P41_07435 [Pseudomonadota bacterium]|nr:hypothetical protein [Pseudomonadota bacterium]